MRRTKKISGPKAVQKPHVSTHHEFVKCDLEFSPFVRQLENLDLTQFDAVDSCIDKIEKMTWAHILATSSKSQKRGLNWEVLDQKTASGCIVASIRITEKFRARVTRDGVYMRFISLHPDHDSAYKESGGEDI